MTFDQFIEEWRNDKEFIRVTTSGSTGQPKEIQLSKDFVKQSALRTNSFFNITSSSRFHSCVSPNYIGGKMMAVRAEIACAELTWEEPSNTPLKDIKGSETIDLLAVVPSQMSFILENKDSIPFIRNIIIGGSAIHPELRKKIASSGLNAYETYGMTETASHIALRKISYEEEPFIVLSGISVSVDGDSCLKIMFETGETISTNDIAEIVSPTSFFIKGRRDNVIISGGKKINPEELEKIISPFINSKFVITGFPDEKWGEKVVLIIEGKPDEVTTKSLREQLANVLERWQLPKEILYVKELPTTPNGKPIRVKKL